MTQVNDPYALLFDLDGEPLEAGYVYIGEKGLNAETNQIAAYWDEALTVSAAQPIRTIAGRFKGLAGKPARLFVDGSYSIVIKDKNLEIVYSADSVSDNNPEFDTPADVLASTEEYATGTIIREKTRGFIYEVAAPAATDAHLTTSGGMKLYVKPFGDAIYLAAFNPAADGVTDDGPLMTLAASVANEANVILRVDPGRYLGRLDLPDFDGFGDAWEAKAATIVETTGWGRTTIVNETLSDDYVIGHPSFLDLTPRAQNTRVVIRNITVEGPKDPSSDMVGIGLSNSFKPLIEGVEFFGFPGGTYVHAWSDNRGGCQGGKMVNCRDRRMSYQIGGSGEQLYSISDLQTLGGRYALRLDGPRDSIGKANDWEMQDCHWNGILIGGVSTEGHGAPLSSGGFPNGGGSDNFRTFGNFFAMEQARKIEENTISAVTSTLEFALTTTPNAFVHDTDDDYNGFGIAVTQGGMEYYDFILDFEGATRTVTLQSGLSITPTTSDTYRIFYADASSRSTFAAQEHQHGLYWEGANLKCDFSFNRLEELEHVVVAHANSNNDVTVYGTYEIVGGGGGFIRQDADPKFMPYAADFNRPRGPENGPRASSVRRDILLANGDDPDGFSALSIMMENGTGADLEVGNIVREGADRGMGIASANYATSEDKHYIVTSADNFVYKDGYWISVAASGRCRVMIDGTASRGDLVVSDTGGHCVAISKASWTVEVVGKALGTVIENKAASGVGLGWVIVR